VNLTGTQTTEGTGINVLISLGVNQMNTLTIIKKQIKKAAALHDAQIMHTAYRGVEYNVNCADREEVHGTFCYRGHVYSK
jgi:hypothetical protein